MTEPLNPGQLPQSAAQFIAYGTEVRVADPKGGEEPLTVRPQTYVVYYRGIQIKDITEGGRSGDADVVTVGFDPESVNLREPISAKIDPDDPLLGYVRQRHEQGQSVDIAIEVIRKKKNANSKQPINVLTPIHALRGAQDASGTKAQTGPSFDNTRKMLVMVDGRNGRALTSNPYEWASLVNNKAGNLPPEGWRFYAPGDSWDQYGAIVPSNTGPRQPAGSPASAQDAAAPADLAGFVSEIEGLLHRVLDYREANPNVEVATGRTVRRRFDEGKQWDVRTNDGRVNLGGYGVQSQAWTYRWAFAALSMDDNTPAPNEVWALADTVMSLSDRVQSDAYGHGVAPDRTTASHKEAVRWVEWVIEHHHPYPGAEADLDAWSGEVTKTAIEYLTESGKRVGDWLKENKAKPADVQPETEEPKGPSPAVIKALLGSIERTWGKRDALVNLSQETADRGLEETEVGISLREDGTPILTHPSDPNATGTAPLGQLLSQRIAELEQAPAEHTEESPTPAPEQKSAAATGTVEQQPDTAPEQPTAESAPVEAAPAQPVAASDPNRGYTQKVVEAIVAIHKATNLGTLRSAYDIAEERTVLQANVSARRAENGRFEFGYNGQDGYPTVTIAQVINALKESFSAPAEAPAEPEPVAQPVQTEEQPEAPVEPAAAQSEPAPEQPAAEQPPAEAAPTEQHATATLAQQIADSINVQTSTSADVTAAIEKAQQGGVFEDSVSVDGRTGLLRAYLHSARKRAEKAGR